MASVWKHDGPKGTYWIGKYKDENMRWRNKSTKIEAKETLRQRAREIAQKWEDDAHRGRKGELTRRHIEEGSRQIAERIYGDSFKRESVREYFNAWLKEREEDTGERTIDSYSTCVRSFLDIIGAKADAPLTSLQDEHLRQFRDSLKDRGLSVSSIRMRCKVIGSALGAAHDHQKIAHNPFKALTLPTEKAESRQPFTLPEVRKLLSNAEGDWKTAILFAVSTGARIGDAVSMRWDGVNLFAGTITFEADKQRRGQEVKETKALHPELHAHLKELHSALGGRPGGFITPSLQGRKSGGRTGLSVEFKAIMEKAGIDAGEKDRKSGWTTSTKSFHSLRHTFVTIGAGIDARAAQSMSGHKTDAMFKHYDHLTLEDQQKLVKAMPSFL